MCTPVNEVDLFISRVAPDDFKLSLYVNNKFVQDLARGMAYEGLIQFVDFIADDIRSDYGDFDVILNPNVYVS